MSKFPRVPRISIGLTLLCALGCHSAKIKNSIANVEPTRRDRWIADYRAARSGSPTACQTFTALAHEAEFPAAPLAELRAREACPVTPTAATITTTTAVVPPGVAPVAPAFAPLDRTTLPTYLQDLGLDVSLSIARRAKDGAAEVELLPELARRRMPQAERIAHLKLALKRARELNLTTRIEPLTAQLYQIAPRLNPEPAPTTFLQVAADYRQAREFAPARRFYERIVSGTYSVEEKLSALKGLRILHKNSRDSDEHLRAAHRLTAYLTRVRALQSKSPKLRAAAYDARAYEARAVWTAGRPAEADRLFAGMELEMRGRQSLADLYWLRARLAEEAQRFDDVTRYLNLALTEKPNDVMRDKILWYAAWNERARGQADAAIEKLKALDLSTKDDSVRTRALYWLGHVQRERGQTRDAQTTFDRVITLDPVGYYGLLAHRQLDRPIKLKTRARSSRPVETPTLDAGLAEWLVALGESDVLASLLDEAVRAYAKRSDQNDDVWTALLENYARAGLYLKLFEGIAQLSPERRRSVLDAHPDLLFPRPWPEVASAGARQFGIDDALIYSIMRQESAFDPHARSGADAFGLMQLLPEVAARTARKHGLPYQRPDDLFQPDVVIPLGAAFLAELSERYRGQLILISAAYNASDAAIKTWVKQRYHGDALSFIEEIPYEETRTYVRLVMRNLIFYRVLKIQPGGLTFPEELLKLDAATGAGPATSPVSGPVTGPSARPGPAPTPASAARPSGVTIR